MGISGKENYLKNSGQLNKIRLLGFYAAIIPFLFTLMIAIIIGLDYVPGFVGAPGLISNTVHGLSISIIMVVIFFLFPINCFCGVYAFAVNLGLNKYKGISDNRKMLVRIIVNIGKFGLYCLGGLIVFVLVFNQFNQAIKSNAKEIGIIKK